MNRFMLVMAIVALVANLILSIRYLLSGGDGYGWVNVIAVIALLYSLYLYFSGR